MLRTSIFAITIGLAALLLFTLEAVIGKQLLPLAGGGPMIWNTCLVFFQIALLLAYLCSHLLSRYCSFRVQYTAAISLLIVGIWGPFYIRYGIISTPGVSEEPQLWLWCWLLTAVLVPFVSLGTLSTLLQQWWTRKPSLKGPYPLYAASNFGSFLGILAYPLFLEPLLVLSEQRLFILITMIVIAVLVGICILCSFKIDNIHFETIESNHNDSENSDLRKIWSLLAATPSSLLLSITAYILTDISAVPLFWMLPLLLYLGTFVYAFSALDSVKLSLLGRITAFLSLPLIVVFVTDANHPPYILIPLHLAAFTFACLYCHCLLVSLRPKNLLKISEFYLWIAFGGAMGGLITLLLAPLIFSIQLEYPIGFILVCLFRAYQKDLHISYIAVLKALSVFIYIVGGTLILQNFIEPKFEILFLGIIYIPSGLIVLNTITKPLAYFLMLSVLLIAGLSVPSGLGSKLATHRNFFGVTRVTTKNGFNRIVHGTTIHGMQKRDRMHACEPASYYHKTGPAGNILLSEDKLRQKVLVIGLGVGSLACYARSTEDWTFFEINPAMESIARNDLLFSFLKNSKAKSISISRGDGRRLLSQNIEKFDLIIIDAFSSDSIPAHLLTTEAFKIYFDHLNTNSKLLIHISNRYFNLLPLLSKIPALFNKSGFFREESYVSALDENEGKVPSLWVLFSSEQSADNLKEWQTLPESEIRSWTDDFSNPLELLKIFN